MTNLDISNLQLKDISIELTKIEELDESLIILSTKNDIISLVKEMDNVLSDFDGIFNHLYYISKLLIDIFSETFEDFKLSIHSTEDNSFAIELFCDSKITVYTLNLDNLNYLYSDNSSLLRKVFSYSIYKLLLNLLDKYSSKLHQILILQELSSHFEFDSELRKSNFNIVKSVFLNEKGE